MRDFIPAVIPPVSNVQELTIEQRHRNCVVTVNEKGEHGLVHRPEFAGSGLFTPSASTNRGRGVFYPIQGGSDPSFLTETNYYYGSSPSSTNITGGNNFNEEYVASFIPVDYNGEQVVFVNAGHSSTNASANHGNAWYVPDDTTAPTRITDADMPGNNGTSLTRGGAFLDGYLFLGDINGQIHNSDLNDITSWTASNFLTAEREPDIGVYIGKHHDNILSICTRSIEFFYNASNTTGSPLNRRQDISYKLGCIFPNAVVENGDEVYFIGTDRSGKHSVYILSRFSLTKISNSHIELELSKVISDANLIYDISGTVDTLTHTVYLSQINNRGELGLLLTITNKSFYWNKGQWIPWGVGASPTYTGALLNWTNAVPIVSTAGADLVVEEGSRFQLAHGDPGNIGPPPSNTNQYYNEFGTSPNEPSYIEFTEWDGGNGRKKRINWLRVVSSTYALDNANTEPRDVNLKWVDMDRVTTNASNAYSDFSNSRTVNINTDASLVKTQGTTRKRKYIIEMFESSSSGIYGLEIDYDIVGT